MTDKITLELEPADNTPEVDVAKISAIDIPEPLKAPIVSENGEIVTPEYNLFFIDFYGFFVFFFIFLPFIIG